jgi:hypothetical protein
LLVKSGGSGTFTFGEGGSGYTDAFLEGSNATIEVVSGTLALADGGDLTCGTFAVSNGATLLLTADNAAFPS